jgi:hypothetical protein
MRPSRGERTWGGGPHTDTLLVKVLHDWRLSYIWRRSLLQMLVWRRMLSELSCPICRALISRVWYLGSLRSRPRHAAGTWPWRHRHAIFGSSSLGRNHLVRVVETRGSISWHAIVEHALELIRVLGRRRCVKEGRWVYSGWIESPIVLARKGRGVGEPGIHVVRFYQPICPSKSVSNSITQVHAPSLRGDEIRGFHLTHPSSQRERDGKLSSKPI